MKNTLVLILLILTCDMLFSRDYTFEIIDTTNYSHIYINDSLICSGTICELEVGKLKVTDTLKIKYYSDSGFPELEYMANLYELDVTNPIGSLSDGIIRSYHQKSPSFLMSMIIEIPLKDILELKNEQQLLGFRMLLTNKENEFKGIICILGFEKGLLIK